MKTKHHIIIAAGVCGLLLTAPSAFSQGALTPPGAPAPTMLTLNQIEPRTPVDATHTGSGGSAEFLISQPGSYYLSTNIVGVSGEHGINISANNVTLDLNGFSLLGVSSAGDGIYIHLGYTNVTVHNGIISGWGNDGIECYANNALLEDIIVSTNSYNGVYFGSGGVIRDCLVENNAANGIYVAGSGSLIFGNNFAGNIVGPNNFASISVYGSNNRIEANHVTGTNTAGYGIFIYGAYTKNMVIRNSVIGSGANNYFFNSSQIVGPLITNAVSGIITNSNPWANFSF
jgi:hypothetical protein